MKPLSPVQELQHPLFQKHNIRVSIKRDDLIHPIISGNKWRKLKGNIAQAKELGKKGIISFGGAYSNHIHALAYACFKENLQAVGIIRGESHYQNNYTLKWAAHWKMQLRFVDRKTYKRRYDSEYLQTIEDQYKNYLVVPEGGSNTLALLGVADVITELKQQSEYNTLMLPVGSGGTIAGLIAADNTSHNIIGVTVLKQGEYLTKEIIQLLPEQTKHYQNWQLLHQYHCGGYAKFSKEDCQKINQFSAIVDVPFEPVYSGKMVLALLDLVEQGFFPSGHKIMLVHTGGLQGLGGLAERGLIEAEQWHLPSVPRVQ